MPTLTLSPTPSQCEAYAEEFAALQQGIRAHGFDVIVEPRGEPRGPVADVLLYLGDHAVGAGFDILLVEALRRMIGRGEASQTSAPRRFVLVDEDGETVRTVDLPV